MPDDPPAHDGGEDVDKPVTEDDDMQTLLTSAVQDPHLKELVKTRTNCRSNGREQAKLAQLEVDSNTPLYPGCE